MGYQYRVYVVVCCTLVVGLCSESGEGWDIISLIGRRVEVWIGSRMMLMGDMDYLAFYHGFEKPDDL